MLHFRSRIALVPAALFFGAPADAGKLPPADGFAVTAEMTSSTEKEKVILTFKFAGENLRLDPDIAALGANDPQASQMMSGAFMLSLPAGKVAFVMPAVGMAMRMDATEMNKPDPAEQKCDSVTVQDLGVGESILGIATRKYRLRTALQASGDRPAGDEITDVSVATSFPEGHGVFKRYAKAFGDQVGGGPCPEEARKFPDGFPLRFRSTKMGPNGPETEEMQVTSVRKVSYADTDFIIPPGMRVMDGNPFGRH
jgi:hypothetical protein